MPQCQVDAASIAKAKSKSSAWFQLSLWYVKTVKIPCLPASTRTSESAKYIKLARLDLYLHKPEKLETLLLFITRHPASALTFGGESGSQ